MGKSNVMQKSGPLRSQDRERVNDGNETLEELSVALSKALDAVWEADILNSIKPPDIEMGIDFYDEVSRFEIALIRLALGYAAGSQRRAASMLGLKPTTLNSKIKVYGLHQTLGLKR
jgi:DNA-binding NtrC family response regulator